MATKPQESSEATESRDESGDGPLMDSVAAAVKKMMGRAKERGYITYDELNSVLPPDQMSSEQIEDTMSALSEMGITDAPAPHHPTRVAGSWRRASSPRTLSAIAPLTCSTAFMTPLPP